MVNPQKESSKIDGEIVTGVNQSIGKNLCEQIEKYLACVDLDYLTPVGSLRRNRSTLNDLDFTVQAHSDSAWLDIVKVLTENNIVKTKGAMQQLQFLAPIGNKKYMAVDFFRAYDYNYGIQVLIRTGSREHNVFLAQRAIRLGMSLSYSKGLIKDGQVIAGANEDEVFKKLGLQKIPPAFREMVGNRPLWSNLIL